MNKKAKIEYRITGRLRCEKKRHIVDFNKKWTKSDVVRRFNEIKHDAELEMEQGARKPNFVGIIGISTEYHSDYDLLDLRIESREVTAWEAL